MLVEINPQVFKKALPVIIGYFFLGLACGILGDHAGITPLQAAMMSILAYSGSGQFICLAMMAEHTSLISILLTNFMVSLRYLFFTTSLYPHIRHKSFPYTMFFAQCVTDETFAVNLDAFKKDGAWTPEKGAGMSYMCCASWTVANFIGCTAAAWLDPPTEVVSYLLVAMFIGIWVGYLKERDLMACGIAGGLISLFLSTRVPYKLHIVLSTLIVSAAATYLALGKKKGGRA